MRDDFFLAGPGGWLASRRVIAVGRWESAPIRRAARKAKIEGRLIDLTYGHACKWVVYMDSGHLILISRELHPLVDLSVEIP